MKPSSLIIPLLFAISLVVAFARIDLLDRTESRVAVVADRLVTQADYLHLAVPKDGVWVPYWAKPPLHYWNIAASMKAFGRTEFAVRLPSLLAALGVLLIIPLFRPSHPRRAQLILASAVLFLGVSGLGLIDTSLTFALGVVLLGLFRWHIEGNHTWLTILYLALGTALACALKGLVGIAVPALSIVLFCVLTRSVKPLKDLPWFSAGAITLTLLTLYFGSIEIANPGFNRYFFLNENILRFLTSDYGDRTGSGHAQPYGMSVLYLLVAFLPWSPFLFQSLRHRFVESERERLLLAAAAAPALLFLFAHHHLATYQLPALLPLALLLADRIDRAIVHKLGFLILAIFPIGALIGAHTINGRFSSGLIIETAQATSHSPIHFGEEIPLSAYWYAGGVTSIDTATPHDSAWRNGDVAIVRKKHREDFLRIFATACAEQKALGKWSFLTCTGAPGRLGSTPETSEDGTTPQLLARLSGVKNAQSKPSHTRAMQPLHRTSPSSERPF